MIFYRLLTTALLIIIIFSQFTYGQSFGFGCLGLSGFTVGYSQQKYDAFGLNKHISDRLADNPTGTTQELFKEGKGFRVGANIVRAKFEHTFLTVKGFYQFLKEEQNLKMIIDDQISDNRIELKMDYWGLGMDFGICVFSFLDWKIIDGGISFYKTRLKQKTIFDDGSSQDKKYILPSAELGYYVGTGLILEIVDGYLSLEGSAYYNYVHVDYLEVDIDDRIPERYSNTSLIEKGKFSGTLQLNFGVPL